MTFPAPPGILPGPPALLDLTCPGDHAAVDDDVMDWASDRQLVDRVFGGQLAAMARVGQGDDPSGGRWEAWADPVDHRRAPRLIARPPRWPGVMIGLLSFGSSTELGYVAHATQSRDGRSHRTFAVSARLDTSRVVVTDGYSQQLELTSLGAHPDGQSSLFAGGTAVLGPPHLYAAFDSTGQLVAELHSRSSA